MYKKDLKELENRIIGKVTGENPGDQLICIAGIHGNEDAGIKAITTLLNELKNQCLLNAGRFVSLVGNAAALEKGERFIDTDLNRMWSPELLQNAIIKPTELRNSEEKELVTLFHTIQHFTADYPGNSIILDLHTTSASGGSFSIIPGNSRSKALATELRVPVIGNVEKVLKTTVMSFYNGQGIAGMAFEAGQHSDPGSVKIMSAAIWVALGYLGLLNQEGCRKLNTSKQILEDASDDDMPPQVEFLHRHPVKSEDNFIMLPGFHNFVPIEKGQLLAHDRNGPIHAPIAGLMLMPLYQKQGEDGFFIVKETS